MPFPRSINKKKWETYLNRKLKTREKNILIDLKAEMISNKSLKIIHQKCDKQNLFVSELTEMDGNCLFESLLFYDFNNKYTTKMFRRLISDFMITNADTKHLFPGNDNTLRDIFTMTNDVTYINTKHRSKRIKFTYNTMCKELKKMDKWHRLPAQLILTVISYIFKFKIIIISDNDYSPTINAYENLTNQPPLRTIYLGHMENSHYIPIDVKEPGYEYERIYYEEEKEYFFEWAKSVKPTVE